MPAAEVDRPIDPFSFDSQSPAAPPNLVTGSFFDEPAAPLKDESVASSESLDPASSANYAMTPVAQAEGFEAATPIHAEPVDTAFSAAPESNSGQFPVAESPTQIPEPEKATDNNFAQTAAIAAAAAIAGAAAGAAVTNALHAKSNTTDGGDFFDVGANATRPSATAGGAIADEEAPFDPFAPAASKPAPSSPASAGPPDDFFSAAPIGRPKRDDGVVDDIKERLREPWTPSISIPVQKSEATMMHFRMKVKCAEGKTKSANPVPWKWRRKRVRESHVREVFHPPKNPKMLMSYSKLTK